MKERGGKNQTFKFHRSSSRNGKAVLLLTAFSATFLHKHNIDVKRCFKQAAAYGFWLLKNLHSRALSIFTSNQRIDRCGGTGGKSVHLSTKFGQFASFFFFLLKSVYLLLLVWWSKLSCEIYCQIEQIRKRDKEVATGSDRSTRLEYFMALSSSAWNSLFTIV